MIKKVLRRLFPVWYAKKHGMIVGEGVSFVSPTSTIFGTEPYLIRIGDYSRISGNVTFVTHDGGTWSFRFLNEYKDVVKYGKITIGKHCFIGCDVVILPGVSIGDNCVVGAGSIVTKSIPSNTVVAGNPARRICSLEEYAIKCKNEMPRIDAVNYHKNKRKELEKVFNDY